MKKNMLIILLALFAGTCAATSREIRGLDQVFSESDTIIYGYAVGAGMGKCGGKEEMESFFLIRVERLIKGDVKTGLVKACGYAYIVMGQDYFIAGNRHSDGEIVFDMDAVVLEGIRGEYYRLISYASPYLHTDNGLAYGIGLIEPAFFERYGEALGISRPCALESGSKYCEH